MAKISLQNIRKVYPGGVEVVPKLNLEIADKEDVYKRQHVFAF